MICARRSLIIRSLFGGTRRVFALADNGEVQVAVGIHHQLLDPGKYLLHGLHVQALARNLRGLAILLGHLVEARGVARGLIDLSLSVSLSPFQHLLRLAASFRNNTVGVSLSFVQNPDRVGPRAGY